MKFAIVCINLPKTTVEMFITQNRFLFLRSLVRQLANPTFNHKIHSLKKLHTENKHIITKSCRHAELMIFFVLLVLTFAIEWQYKDSNKMIYLIRE